MAPVTWWTVSLYASLQRWRTTQRFVWAGKHLIISTMHCWCPSKAGILNLYFFLVRAPQVFTDGQDLRRRAAVAGEVGQPENPIVATEAPPKPARSPPETPPADAPHSVWSPLLVNTCVCTVLALGAYVCYRTFVHWCSLSISVDLILSLFLPSAGCWGKRERQTHTDAHTFSAGPVSQLGLFHALQHLGRV